MRKTIFILLALGLFGCSLGCQEDDSYPGVEVGDDAGEVNPIDEPTEPS